MPPPGDRVWPHRPAADGKYYGITDKFGAKLIVMTEATWEQMGTIIESSRVTMRAQDGAIKQQSTYIREVEADRNDLLQKHTNLRSSHRELLERLALKDLNVQPDRASDYLTGISTPPTRGLK